MNSKDFDYKRVAQGYKDRPFLHGQVIDKFRREVADKKFFNGLDVGCGAGLSSKALRKICRHVTGADISAKMIEAAKEVCADEQGYVIVYDFGISDKMKGSGSENYSSWWHHAYLKEFPKPSRNEYIWTGEDVRQHGFSMLRQVSHEMEYEFDRDAFIRFMLIQSNVNAKIEGEGRRIEEVRRWFEQSLSPVFQEEKKVLIFSGYSWYMRA